MPPRRSSSAPHEHADAEDHERRERDHRDRLQVLEILRPPGAHGAGGSSCSASVSPTWLGCVGMFDSSGAGGGGAANSVASDGRSPTACSASTSGSVNDP